MAVAKATVAAVTVAVAAVAAVAVAAVAAVAVAAVAAVAVPVAVRAVAAVTVTVALAAIAVALSLTLLELSLTLLALHALQLRHTNLKKIQLYNYILGGVRVRVRRARWKSDRKNTEAEAHPCIHREASWRACGEDSAGALHFRCPKSRPAIRVEQTRCRRGHGPQPLEEQVHASTH